MAGRNFPVVLLVGRNDIFANPVCFLMLTSFELVSYFVPSTGAVSRFSLSREAGESLEERRAIKFASEKNDERVSNVQL